MRRALTARREFLKMAGGVVVPGRRKGGDLDLRAARALIRRGSLGKVAFCRVLRGSVGETMEELRFLFDGAAPVSVDGQNGRATLRYARFVASYEESDRREIVLCGSEATMVVNRRGLSLHRRSG